MLVGIQWSGRSIAGDWGEGSRTLTYVSIVECNEPGALTCVVEIVYVNSSYLRGRYPSTAG